MGDTLQTAVTEALAAARERWPEIRLAAAALAAHVSQHAINAETVRTRGCDLVLAVACAAGDAGAIAVFEREHLGHVPSYVKRLSLTPQMLDEVRQQLRIHLLVARPSRFAKYRGTGPLGGWVRVVATRVALDLLAATGHSTVERDDAAVASSMASETLPEAELLRARCRPLLQAAVEQSVAALEARDRAVLRFHYVEGLNVDAIGTIYRVHRATAARWLADIRRKMLQAVQARLALELRLTASEVHSLVGIVRQELGLSISRLLGK